ncbi:uncharacterized protein LOC109862586, partial [Pseudomyrmex gracilis]|uniref:uncharacterized protein LOC109862586 n=1 Tax=Pseudomyrmex gracilis TaxID=219809 RepID=UPI00099494AF
MFATTKPEKPASVSYTLHDNSIITLLWYHPWKTNRQLKCFLIDIEENTSYLKQRISQSTAKKKYEYSVEEYMRNYTKLLHLYPSTLYRIYIRSMTITNETSLYNYVNVQTPSTATFDGDLHDVPDEFNSTISLQVPHILNDTYDSCIHIIVKGPTRCKNSKIPDNLLNLANVKKNDVAWQAAEVS